MPIHVCAGTEEPRGAHSRDEGGSPQAGWVKGGSLWHKAQAIQSGQVIPTPHTHL